MNAHPLTAFGLAFLAFFLGACSDRKAAEHRDIHQPGSFQYSEIDAAGPNAPWGKATGDLNGDGLIDVIVGGHEPKNLTIAQRIARKTRLRSFDDWRGELVWYENPGWIKRTISHAHAIRTDIETGDMDGDGDIDVIAATDDGIGWFRNPDWSFLLIDSGKYHDVEISDLDNDHLLEIVVRNQSSFGYENGDEIYVFGRSGEQSWTKTVLPSPHGEGLKVTDINRDKRPDILVNGTGYLNDESIDGNLLWHQFQYGRDPTWADTSIGAGDIDGDGWKDIVLSPAESAGQKADLTWFRNPGEFGSEPESRFGKARGSKWSENKRGITRRLR